jgi:hypothetical protein
MWLETVLSVFALAAAPPVSMLPLHATPPAHAAPPHAAAAALTRAPSLEEQPQPLLAIRYDPDAGYRPSLRVGPVLASAQIENAARSGVPIRVRIRVELWRDRFFDQLVDSTSWSTVIVYEPISRDFFVRTLPAGAGARRFPSFAAARSTVEQEFAPRLQPRVPGRYYYTSSLQIETLSLSDLDELERWLQGELQPAVSGQRSVPGALGQGAKRLMLRLLDLPHRRVDARTDRFTWS